MKSMLRSEVNVPTHNILSKPKSERFYKLHSFRLRLTSGSNNLQYHLIDVFKINVCHSLQQHVVNIMSIRLKQTIFSYEYFRLFFKNFNVHYFIYFGDAEILYQSKPNWTQLNDYFDENWRDKTASQIIIKAINRFPNSILEHHWRTAIN